MPAAMAAIGEGYDFEAGAFWGVDERRAARAARPSGAPTRPPRPLEVAQPRTSSSKPGQDLPGVALADRTATWVRKVTYDPDFSRAAQAREGGPAQRPRRAAASREPGLRRDRAVHRGAAAAQARGARRPRGDLLAARRVRRPDQGRARRRAHQGRVLRPGLARAPHTAHLDHRLHGHARQDRVRCPLGEGQADARGRPPQRQARDAAGRRPPDARPDRGRPVRAGARHGRPALARDASVEAAAQPAAEKQRPAR